MRRAFFRHIHVARHEGGLDVTEETEEGKFSPLVGTTDHHTVYSVPQSVPSGLFIHPLDAPEPPSRGPVAYSVEYGLEALLPCRPKLLINLLISIQLRPSSS